MRRAEAQRKWWASPEAHDLYWGEAKDWPPQAYLNTPEEGLRYGPREAVRYAVLPSVSNGGGRVPGRRSPLFKTVADQSPGDERRRLDFTAFWAWWVETGRALGKRPEGVSPKDGLAGLLPLQEVRAPRRRRQTLAVLGRGGRRARP